MVQLHVTEDMIFNFNYHTILLLILFISYRLYTTFVIYCYVFFNVLSLLLLELTAMCS